MSMALNTPQRKIGMGALVFALFALLFPPLNIERRFSGLSDGTSLYDMTVSEFAGWGFIAQGYLVLFEGGPARPKDPDNPTFLERFEYAKQAGSLDGIRIGKKKIAGQVLALELAVLFILAALGLLAVRTCVKTDEAQENTGG